MKKCTKCKLHFPLDSFYNDKNRKDGKYPQCKPCVNEQRRKELDAKTCGRTLRERQERLRDSALIKQGLKRCSACKEVFALENFHKHAGRKDGKASRCIPCARKDKRKDYQKHRQSRIEKMAEERARNPEKVSNSKKAAYRKNRSHYLEKARKWRERNSERVKKNKSKWHQENKSRISDAVKKRYREDHRFRAAVCMRRMLNKFIKRSGGKKPGRTHEVLGYSYDEFKRHIEIQFERGMSWDNYGEWHIDHIIPVAEHIRRGEMDPAVVNCLTNLRPMWAKDNIRKSDSLTYLL